MAKPKVVLLTSSKERGEFTVSMAPQDMEVSWIDNSLPDDEKLPLCKDADALMVVPPVVSVDLLKNCPKVKLIQTLTAGYDQLDVKAIGELGIPIAHNGRSHAVAGAEQTIAMMITLSKQLAVQWNNAMKERRWRGGLTGFEMTEVSYKTVGIVGLGIQGKAVAQRLKGFETRTIYYDIVEMPLEVQQELNAQPVSFEELLRQSDIITLHVPLTSTTQGMIGGAELGMMKPTAFLINHCRGAILDQKALYQALKGQRLAGAGLDVLEQEPIPPDDPLLELDNVVITPHVACWSYETSLRAAQFAYANIERALAGEPTESLVTAA